MFMQSLPTPARLTARRIFGPKQLYPQQECQLRTVLGWITSLANVGNGPTCDFANVAICPQLTFTQATPPPHTFPPPVSSPAKSEGGPVRLRDTWGQQINQEIAAAPDAAAIGGLCLGSQCRGREGHWGAVWALWCMGK